MAINLLPKELTQKGPVVVLARKLKKVAIAALILFLISAVGLIGFFLFLSFQLRASVQRQEELKVSIKSLEQTEQRLILVKDRVEKAGKVLAIESASEEVEGLKGLVLSLPVEVSLAGASLSKEAIGVTIEAVNSASLVQFFASLTVSPNFDQIVLKSLNFNPDSGYTVSLGIK